MVTQDDEAKRETQEELDKPLQFMADVHKLAADYGYLLGCNMDFKEGKYTITIMNPEKADGSS